MLFGKAIDDALDLPTLDFILRAVGKSRQDAKGKDRLVFLLG
jgi:hypothetical protein